MSLPFDSLPLVWQVTFLCALVLIATILVWTGVLFVLAQRARRHPPTPSQGPDSRFLWVFIVPALDEEITIRDSVERLLAVEVEHSRIVVVDDASEDRTPQILAEESAAHPEIDVVVRRPPNAREGKAAALNAAYRGLDPVISGWDRERVIVVVVDADGRLHPSAPRYAAAHFADPAVGAVQALVRIYNRWNLLTRMQDVEFSIYGFLYQAGRTMWGTAGMGGNGQFTRLVALDSIADEVGPWRDRLTEDQDLGLRLVRAGWRGHQDLRAIVDQQGLSNLRLLYRQRARWAQGNLQAMALLPTIEGAPRSLISRIELTFYLLNPVFQGFVGLVLAAAIALAATGVAGFWGEGPAWQLVLFYVLGFGGVIFGCLARGAPRGGTGILWGLLLAQVYAFYSWILWPVLVRAAWRQVTRQRGWAKTQRETMLEPAADA